MPSWNIHTAHVERLLNEESPSALGIRDTNCFLFGNFVPDIYVGYMVKNPTHTIDYKITHISQANPIPVPEAETFWQRYCTGAAPSDVVLGAWAHLVCDQMYNQATRAVVADRHITITEQTRIQKQGDFATFGRTLPITLTTEVTPELLDEAESFPQYPVLEPDVRAAVEAANDIVTYNQTHHINYEPDYAMLTEDFFLETFERVNTRLITTLRAFAAGTPAFELEVPAAPEAHPQS